MATNFPTSLDAFTNPVSSDTLDNPPHDQQHADVNDAMEAVQAKLGVGAHTIGEWTTYTPVWTGVTVGNGTVTARYCRINKIVFWQVELVVGSTTSVGTSNVRITYPVPAAQIHLSGNGGQVTHEDVDGVDYIGTLIRLSGAGCYVYVVGASSTYASVGPISPTVPFTWAAGDRIVIQDFYEAA